jgi:hypothetical protein
LRRKLGVILSRARKGKLRVMGRKEAAILPSLYF